MPRKKPLTKINFISGSLQKPLVTPTGEVFPFVVLRKRKSRRYVKDSDVVCLTRTKEEADHIVKAQEALLETLSLKEELYDALKKKLTRGLLKVPPKKQRSARKKPIVKKESNSMSESDMRRFGLL